MTIDWDKILVRKTSPLSSTGRDPDPDPDPDPNPDPNLCPYPCPNPDPDPDLNPNHNEPQPQPPNKPHTLQQTTTIIDMTNRLNLFLLTLSLSLSPSRPTTQPRPTRRQIPTVTSRAAYAHGACIVRMYISVVSSAWK